MNKVDKEVLKDGKVLQAMENRFLEEQSEDRMLQLLDCLTDSQVIIPCNARISEKNKAILEGAKIGETISLADDMGFTPDNLIAPDGKRYIPLFSNENQADPEYLKHFSVLHLYVSDLMPMYDNLKGEADGFLLDYAVGIRGNLVDVMKKMCELKKSGEFYKGKEEK